MARPDLTLTEWTDEDLEQLAEMTPERQVEAEEWWRERAPSRWRGLLEAKGEKEEKGRRKEEGEIGEGIGRI